MIPTSFTRRPSLVLKTSLSQLSRLKFWAPLSKKQLPPCLFFPLRICAACFLNVQRCVGIVVKRIVLAPRRNFLHISSTLQNQKPKNGEYFTEEDWSHTLVPDGGYTYSSQPFESYGRSKVNKLLYKRAPSHMVCRGSGRAEDPL